MSHIFLYHFVITHLYDASVMEYFFYIQHINLHSNMCLALSVAELRPLVNLLVTNSHLFIKIVIQIRIALIPETKSLIII